MLTISFSSLPSMNMRAMPLTCDLMPPPSKPPAKLLALSAARRAGFRFTSSLSRYSLRCRAISPDDWSVGSTSTKRKSWTLNVSSFIAQSVMAAYMPFVVKSDGAPAFSMPSKIWWPKSRVTISTEVVALMVSAASIMMRQTTATR